ncbi:MAG: TonB-dependent receptor [Bacteroidota bacterium]
MKKLLFTITLIFIVFSISAQERQNPKNTEQKRNLTMFDVSGRVYEKSTNQPLEYATIILKPLKGDRIFGGITNRKGEFIIEVPQGKYNISIEFLSFKTKTLGDKKIDQNTNLGAIYLEDDAEALGEVELIAEKSTVEIRLDKKIYNVGKDMTVKGGTASDVLDNVPSVTVDTDGVVSLRGNENVRILINGKPSGLVGISDTEALRQFPADAIQKVEVITSPSARYDAEGTAGILNIILRKGKALGFNGSTTINGGIPESYGFSANLNYRTKKFNLFNNTGYSYSDSPGYAKFDTEYFSTSIPSKYVFEERDYNRKGGNLNTNFGIEYFLTDNSSLTGSVLYRKSNRNTFINNLTKKYDENFIENEIYNRDSEEDNDYVNWQYALNYINNFKKSGHKLTLDFQYQDNNREGLAYITENVTYPAPVEKQDEKDITDEIQNKLLLQGDYVLPIGEDQQFEAGFRSNMNSQTTDYSIWFKDEFGDFIKDDNISNIFNYDEKIHALYSQYGNKFGKLSALFGLRMEITDIEISVTGEDLDAKKDYIDYFPTVNLSYELSEDQNFTLGYNRRIRRPRSRFINPFPSRTSKNNIFQGNPYIDPSISDGIDLGYFKRWDKVTFNSSLYYTHATDVFQFISEDTGETTEDGIPIIRRTPINLSTNDRYGFEFSVNYTPIKSWRINGSFNFYNSEIEGIYEGIDYGSTNISWFARFSSKVVLPADIDWQTTMMYRGPSENSQTKRNGMFMANMAFSKDILKGDGTISLNISDLFNSRKREMETFTDSYYSESEFQWRKRQIRLSFTYRFKQKKKRERQRFDDGGGDEEIMGG